MLTTVTTDPEGSFGSPRGGKGTVWLILDTNVYLHYRMFDEIDWKGFLETEDVTLVVPITVIHELDDKKFLASNSRIKQRAADVLRKLMQFYKGEEAPRNGIRVVLRTEEPTIKWEAHGLHESSNDDRLIAEILMLRQETADTICLVAADTGLWLKAQARGIEARQPLEDWRLREEDERDRRIRTLEEELARLKQRLPALRLRLAGADADTGVKRVEFDLSATRGLSKEEIRERVQEKERELRQVASKYRQVAGLLLGGVPPTELERYERELKEFLGAYESYLLKLDEYRRSMALTARIGFVLSNTGNAPADDIDVILHFPDGFDVLDVEDLPEPPEEPHEPTPPRTEWQRLTEMMNLVSASPRIPLPELKVPDLHRPRPFIKRTGSYEVSCFLRTLKHGFEETLPELAIRFRSADEVRPFHITYMIAARNVPSHTKGRLHVVTLVKGTR